MPLYVYACWCMIKLRQVTYNTLHWQYNATSVTPPAENVLHPRSQCWRCGLMGKQSRSLYYAVAQQSLDKPRDKWERHMISQQAGSSVCAVAVCVGYTRRLWRSRWCRPAAEPGRAGLVWAFLLLLYSNSASVSRQTPCPGIVRLRGPAHTCTDKTTKTESDVSRLLSSKESASLAMILCSE